MGGCDNLFDILKLVVDTIKTYTLLCAQAETQLILFLKNISEKL